MKENDKTEEWYAELRRVAERKVRVAQGDVVDMTSLVHELEVRQVELELQNEELRHARNETEAALARYADLFEFAPVAYFTLDERGLILQANLTASVYLDLPRSQINGQPFENFLIPDSRVRLNPLLDHVFRTGQREVFEVVLRHKNGALLHVRIGARMAESRPECLLAVIDISDRVQAELALRESEARLRKMLQVGAVGVILFDDAGTVIEANNTFLELTGYTRSAVESRQLTLARLAPPEGQEGVAEQLRQLALGRRIDACERECVRRDGERIWVILAAASLGDGTSVQFCVDIRQLKQAQQDLAARESTLRLVTEHSPDRIFLLDREGRLRFTNAAGQDFLRQVGSRPDEPISEKLGKTAEQLYADPELGRAAGASDRRVIESGRAETIEDTVSGAPGARIYQVIRSPLRDGSGQVTGLVGTARDITEHKLGEALRIAQSEERRDTLVREVHHRIKNHLQGVIGLLNNRQMQAPEIAGALQDSIDQIRVIAEVYGLQSEREPSPITLCELAATVLQGSAGPVPVTCICPSGKSIDGPVLVPNEVMPVSLILNELVSNGHKHLREPVADRPVRVEVGMDQGRALLRVRSGPAQLPAGFDFALGRGTGTGLELIRAMLPSVGAQLLFRQEGDEVLAELVLEPPVIMTPPDRS